MVRNLYFSSTTDKNSMYMPTVISGFADEVSDDLSTQIQAIRELGWSHIDLRSVDGKNISSLNDAEFSQVLQELQENGIEIGCFGSTIANWGRDATDSLELDLAEMRNSIRHMQKAGVRYIRIMSYQLDSPLPLDSDHERVVIENIRQIVRLAEDGGVVCVHENCETWGGQSCRHSLRLLEQVDSEALKLVFDTGNPVGMHHVAGMPPYEYQDPLKFFQEVREHVAYLHIKDAAMEAGRLRYTFPGEGAGRIREILAEVRRHEMQVPIAIEPHVAAVFHDPSIKAPFEVRWNNFIDYGNQLVRMAQEAGITFSHAM
jgi:sugar phosphate isomerase/epimerase